VEGSIQQTGFLTSSGGAGRVDGALHRHRLAGVHLTVRPNCSSTFVFQGGFVDFILASGKRVVLRSNIAGCWSPPDGRARFSRLEPHHKWLEVVE